MGLSVRFHLWNTKKPDEIHSTLQIADYTTEFRGYTTKLNNIGQVRPNFGLSNEITVCLIKLGT